MELDTKIERHSVGVKCSDIININMNDDVDIDEYGYTL